MTRIEKLKKVTFDNDIMHVEALWRQSQGNKDAAYDIVRQHARHYGLTDLTDFEIDIAIGELNDGIEVEWES
jgi:hypothetical protein